MPLSAETMRLSRRRMSRWRDLLWQSVLEEFAERDADKAEAAWAIIRAQPTRALYGSSTREALAVWPVLDTQARLDWVWACQLIHSAWMDEVWSVPEGAEATD